MSDFDKLCVGQFKPLKPYFSIFDSVDDLRLLEEEDLISIAEGIQHKILMKLFYKKKLKVFFVKTKISHLTLTGKVTSSKFDIKSIDKWSMKSVPTQVWGFLKDDDCQNNINLSCNNLSDCDMKYIKELVSGVPNLNIINLSYNNFTDNCLLENERSPLSYILEKSQYLDMTFTPFANNKALLRSLLNEYMGNLKINCIKKLIFIPFDVFISDNWLQDFVDIDNYCIETIKNTHKMYYEDN